MTIPMEVRAVQALQNYVNAKPEHDHGLCDWLTGSTDDVNGYDLICAAAAGELVPKYLRYRCLGNEVGPTPARVALARKLIRLIETGRLTYKREWKARTE